MKKHFIYITLMLLMFWSTSLFSQSLKVVPNSISDTSIKQEVKDFKNPVRVSAIIIPSVALGYGFVKLGNNALTNLDIEAKHEFYSEHPHKQFIVDNYLQFAPGVTVFALNAFGIKGKK